MTPTQDPIDDFIVRLRSVGAPSATVPVKARPAHRTARVLTPAFLVAGALIGVVCLRPQRALGAGWEIVLAQTAQAQSRHVRQYEPSGHLNYEMWRSPGRLAFWNASRGAEGRAEKVISEYRSDGRRHYQFTDEALLPNVRPATNSHVVGTIRTQQNDGGFDHNSASSNFDDFVKMVGGAVTEVREGDHVAYRVRQTKAHRVSSGRTAWKWVQDSYLIRIDDQRRVAEMISDDGTRVMYEYPTEIPASVFEPRPQKRIVPVIDIDKARATARERIRTGYGTKNGVTLRLVFMDRRGELWILWTGLIPNGSLRPHARLIDVPTGTAYGPKELTSDSGLTLGQAAPPSLGKRLGGHALVPTVGIGDHVSIAIPSPKGTATFLNVPVLRIGEFRDLSVEMGLEPLTARTVARPGK